MLLRIFETPLIDVLLILLAIRFIWPAIFGIKKKKKAGTKSPDNSFRESAKSKMTHPQKDEGKYIDFEEIRDR